MGLVVVGAALTFAPWSYSGTRGRSSYELVRSAERLTLLDGGYPGAVATAWKAMPILAALVLLLGFFVAPRWARLLSVVFSLFLALAAFLVVAAPKPLRSGLGAKAALAVAVLTFLLAAIGPRGRLGTTVLDETP